VHVAVVSLHHCSKHLILRFWPRANEYDFAKLTKHWWVDFINSFRYDFFSEKPSHQINIEVVYIDYKRMVSLSAKKLG
jgi:hypothetical protein